MKALTDRSSLLLTPEEAATRLKVTPHTLAVWRCEKRQPLSFVKVGRLVRYRADDLDAFISRNVYSAA